MGGAMGEIADRLREERADWLKRAKWMDPAAAEIVLQLLVEAGFSGEAIWNLVGDYGIYVPPVGSYFEDEFHYDCRPMVKLFDGTSRMKTRVSRDMDGKSYENDSAVRCWVLRVLSGLGLLDGMVREGGVSGEEVARCAGGGPDALDPDDKIRTDG